MEIEIRKKDAKKRFVYGVDMDMDNIELME
jgi:hypothetical protein